MMHHYQMTAVGIEHEHDGMLCEDQVTTFRWGSIYAQACADGWDGRGGVEAKSLCDVITQQLAMYYRTYREMSPERLRRELLRLIRREQERLIHDGALREDELGCTVVAAAMDTRSHTYIGVSLGDGILLGRDDVSGCVLAELPPEKRPAGGAYMTCDTDEEILRHMRCVCGRSRDALMVSSNGLEDTLWNAAGRKLSPTVHRLMRWVAEEPERVQEEFSELLYDLSLPDDAGVAVMVDRCEPVRAWRGNDPGLLCRRRRDARRYLSYLRSRDRGYSRTEAAQRAGWGWRSGCVSIRYMRAIGLD